MKPKVFTLEKANSALPLVRRIVADIRKRYDDVMVQKQELFAIAEKQPSKISQDEMQEMRNIRRRIQQLVDQINEYVDELAEIGAELKDPQKGLIDFYCQHEDRLVYLCWHHGENEIQYWHELEAGFAGRQPVSGLLPSSDSL